jgi:hypothetical protein
MQLRSANVNEHNLMIPVDATVESDGMFDFVLWQGIEVRTTETGELVVKDTLFFADFPMIARNMQAVR